MLNEWAIAWGVPLAALQDLRRRMGALDDWTPPAAAGRSEAWVQNTVRVEASQLGWRVFRNNVGVLNDETGRPVRYGLANDTPALNKRLKSGDLIGMRPVVIEARHVGSTIAQFVSLECKPEGWHFTGTPREEAQQAWAAFVVSMGGHAAFVNRAGALA